MNLGLQRLHFKWYVVIPMTKQMFHMAHGVVQVVIIARPIVARRALQSVLQGNDSSQFFIHLKFIKMSTTLSIFMFSNLLNIFFSIKDPGQDCTIILEPNKQPSQQFCVCNDGSIYSYGAFCYTGAKGCEPNDCPPPPDGCGIPN